MVAASYNWLFHVTVKGLQCLLIDRTFWILEVLRLFHWTCQCRVFMYLSVVFPHSDLSLDLTTLASTLRRLSSMNKLHSARPIFKFILQTHTFSCVNNLLLKNGFSSSTRHIHWWCQILVDIMLCYVFPYFLQWSFHFNLLHVINFKI